MIRFNKGFVQYCRLLIALLMSVLWAPVVTGAPQLASGTFVANQSCPAYQSKNKQTNPGQWMTQAQRHYQINEVIDSPVLSWVRITVPGAEPELRWVNASCGEATYQARKPQEQGALSTFCRTPGKATSYVFAVSWQPGFCQTVSNYDPKQKPECEVRDESVNFASNFVIHGLWPNHPKCNGQNKRPWYGYCGDVQGKPEKNPNTPTFCDYPPVELSKDVRRRLGQAMPSAKYGSCLQRHEWHNHGTCQTVWDADGYYNQSMVLLEQVNMSSFARFVRTHIGEEVAVKDLRVAWQTAFGQNTDQQLRLQCRSHAKRSYLTELQIALPLEVEKQTELAALLHMAEPGKFRQGKCGEKVYIDPIGR
ncbi:ribonuclease T2 family protein [Vibrio sp. T11.5]|uniref:ribonuclease T2 family protein n=1 Tax=Vibrio sp. T11.5 TaxID=2998836 RepID=UPI0022CD5AD2|nr:ribonuclease T2 family protein [Vibrio sp. T11.5]MDA0120029.1 ribonuclease T2 family protein [Vibrio sp. T11.5]